MTDHRPSSWIYEDEKKRGESWYGGEKGQMAASGYHFHISAAT